MAYQEQHTQRRGLAGWSLARWLVVLGLAAIVAVVVLLVLYMGGGGSGGGGGY